MNDFPGRAYDAWKLAAPEPGCECEECETCNDCGGCKECGCRCDDRNEE